MSSDDDVEAILRAESEGDCREDPNDLLARADRRRNAVDVSNTDNFAAVRRNNGREIIILFYPQNKSFGKERSL